MNPRYFFERISNPLVPRKRLVASRSVAKRAAFFQNAASGQQRRSVTFFGKGGARKRSKGLFSVVDKK